jgi:hypothetical protein
MPKNTFRCPSAAASIRYLAVASISRGVDSLDREGVLAELTTQEAEEQTVQVAAHIGRGVDDERPLLGIGSVTGVEPNLRFAVKALGSHERENERGFDILEWHGWSKGVAVDVGSHDVLR